MKPQKITSDVSQCKYLCCRIVAALALCLGSLSTQAESLWQQDLGQISIPANYQPGYAPTLRFVIEEDTETGTYIAHSSTQARFNRLWMNQDRDKTGKHAEKEILELGAKALYKAIYSRSKTVSGFLPDEEGKMPLKSGFKNYKVDYDVRVRSSSLALGMNISF